MSVSLFLVIEVISCSLQKRTLSEFYLGHSGMSWMKSLVSSYVFWPGRQRKDCKKLDSAQPMLASNQSLLLTHSNSSSQVWFQKVTKTALLRANFRKYSEDHLWSSHYTLALTMRWQHSSQSQVPAPASTSCRPVSASPSNVDMSKTRLVKKFRWRYYMTYLKCQSHNVLLLKKDVQQKGKYI